MMDMTMTKEERATRIEESVRTAYAASGARVVFPSEAFVEAGLGSESEVEEAFLLLAQWSVGEARVSVRCPSGHTIWDGLPGDVEHPMQCTECTEEEAWTEEDGEYEPNDQMRFVFDPRSVVKSEPSAPARSWFGKLVARVSKAAGAIHRRGDR